MDKALRMALTLGYMQALILEELTPKQKERIGKKFAQAGIGTLSGLQMDKNNSMKTR